MTNPSEGIYPVFDRVKKYCEDHGLLDRLQKHLEAPEKDRFDAEETEKSGLPVLDAVHCVIDRNRTIAFMDEIRGAVRAGDSVLEAGVGTGILSFEASLKAGRVVGIELNAETLALANDIKRHLAADSTLGRSLEKVEFFHGDATRFVPPGKFDVFISENIYTGMFYEKQVQIGNGLNGHMAEGFRAIPERMLSFASLVEATYPGGEHEHAELFVPIEHEDDMGYRELSKRELYSELVFNGPVDELIAHVAETVSEADGVVNGLLITSVVGMPSGRTIKGSDTIFFNNDIVLGVNPPTPVRKGQRVRVKIEYHAGDAPEDMLLEVTAL